MQKNNLLRGRDLGSTGTSIGTHLMLESLFSYNYELYDKERIFKTIDPSKYDYHIYNIFTIVRNILTSYPEIKNKQEILLNKDFGSVLAMEMENLTSVYMHSGTKLKPLLFYPDYKKVYKEYNKGKIINDTVPKQLQSMMDIYLTSLRKSTNIGTINKPGTYKLPKIEGNCLFTTHIACDLFNPNKYSLLESHTGILKSVSEYNSKYHSIGKNSLSHLPWCEELLYMLGDHIFITPLNLILRRKLYEISIKNNWTVKTSVSKVRANIMRDTELYTHMAGFTKMYS